MFKGYLKYFVMKYLKEQDMSGYGLMKKLGQATGKKPSPGSMYPLLKEMEKTGLLKSQKKGKTKNYKLTEKGKKTLKEFSQQKDRLADQIRKNTTVLLSLAGKDEKDLLRHIKTHTIDEEKILRASSPELITLKTNILRIVHSKDYEKKESEMRKILKETNQRLRKLR